MREVIRVISTLVPVVLLLCCGGCSEKAPSAPKRAGKAGTDSDARRAARATAPTGTVLTLATTTSTEDSGLLNYIHPDFEKKTGINIKVVGQGTGASMQLGREGNADVLLVHARAQEDEFMAQGYGDVRRDVMYNDFIIIGPAEDPAGVKSMMDAAAAFKKIAAAQAPFVSRGDNSGTHTKEIEIWRASGVPVAETKRESIRNGKPFTISSVAPPGDWYLSIGQGMGEAIGYATQKRAYLLADRGTYYAYAAGEPPRTDLIILCEGDPRLFNPYGVIAVSHAKFPHVQHDAAMKYIDWITSPAVQQMIGEYRQGGKVLFHPTAATPGR